MPCGPRKARVLLKEGKAKVYKRTPFTIQLTIPTGETKQEILLVLMLVVSLLAYQLQQKKQYCLKPRLN